MVYATLPGFSGYIAMQLHPRKFVHNLVSQQCLPTHSSNCRADGPFALLRSAFPLVQTPDKLHALVHLRLWSQAYCDQALVASESQMSALILERPPDKTGATAKGILFLTDENFNVP